MADPRNIAHDKKVDSDKTHHHEAILPGASETPQPGRKPTLEPADEPNETYQEHSRTPQIDEASR